jgi:hypothetical protein
MKSKLKFFILFACIGLFVSCAKDGATGPAGPTGATGATGPQGPGATSQILVVNTSDWVHTGTVGQSGDGYAATKNVSIITADIVQHGSIFVYTMSDTTSSAQCNPVPQTNFYTTNSRTWAYNYTLGSVTFTVMDSNHNTPNPGSGFWKVVAVPASHRPMLANVDVSNYAAVKAALHLRD